MLRPVPTLGRPADLVQNPGIGNAARVLVRQVLRTLRWASCSIYGTLDVWRLHFNHDKQLDY